MKKRLIVHLRLHKGKTLLYDAAGRVTNESHLYKIEHGTMMYDIVVLKKNLANEYGVVSFLEVTDYNGNKLSDLDFQDEPKGYFDKLIAQIKIDIANIYNSNAQDQTPEQKRIAELEAKIELLMSSKAVEEPKGNATAYAPNMVDDAVRAEYEQLFGKKPHHLKSIEKLKEEIAFERLNN